MNFRRIAVIGNLLLAAVLMLAVWVLVVYVASRPVLRGLIDLTPQSVNSVDAVTEELMRDLRDLKVEVEFHLFFPVIRGQAQSPAHQQEMAIRRRLQERTEMLVRRYQVLGGEGVKIQKHDLATNIAATTEAAQAFEYKGPFSEVVVTVKRPGRERRFRKLSLLSDLAEIRMPQSQQNPGPGAQVQVPILKRYLGEVQLSSAIKSLLVQGTPVAYFLKGYSNTVDFRNTSINAAYGNFWVALQNLGFETREFSFTRQRVVPRDASLVIVLEPQSEFPDLDAEALFEYVRRGGRLFLNYSWSPMSDWNPTGGKLGELLGYELSRLPVYHLVRDVRGGGRGLDGNEAVAKLQLGLNGEHPVTRRLAQERRRMEVGAARELRPRPSPPGGITIEPLLATGEQGWLARLGPDGHPDLRAPSMQLQKFLVGAAIEVAPEAVSPEAVPPETEPRAGDRPTKGRAVIVTGAFCNNAGIQMFGDLAFNICNWLAERKVLMNIQSNKYQPRQLNVQPQQIDRVHTLLVQVVPSIFLLAGIAVFFVRRRL